MVNINKGEIIMVTSYSRGHAIYYDGVVWRYSDDHSVHDDSRTCNRCGKAPTKEGFDSCMGYIDGAGAACCGHGIHASYIMLNGKGDSC